MTRVKRYFAQRAYTKNHRAIENADGMRLAILDDYPMVTLMGRRPWCDAKLQECPHPSHTLCCYCSHTDQNPYKEQR